MGCLSQIITPANPCLNSVLCSQYYSSDCIKVKTPLACLTGSDISLTAALGQICTTLGSIPSPDCCLMTTKISLSRAEILALHTVPIVMLPAPGVGKLIVVLNIVGRTNFVTSPYNTNTALSLYMGTESSLIYTTTILLEATATSVYSLYPSSGETFTPNTAVYATVDGGNPVGGDNTVDIYITYKIITL